MTIQMGTKKILELSLEDLLKTKSLNSISIADIVNNCGMSRTTFYRHFEDKYDLLYWVLNTPFQKNLEQSLPKCGLKYYQMQGLVFMKENSVYYFKFMRSLEKDSFIRFLYNVSLSDWEKYILKDSTFDSLPEEIQFSIKLYTYGIIHMNIEWLESGMKKPPEKVTDMLLSSIPKNILEYIHL